MHSRLKTLVFALAGLLPVPHVASAQSAIPGHTYTTHYLHSTADSTGARRVVADYAVRATFAGGRGRLDVVQGTQPGGTRAGDYTLVEGADLIIVHPSAKSFTRPPAPVSDAVRQLVAEHGFLTRTEHVKASLDTLGPSETIDGHPTQHYRMNVSYTFISDPSGLLPDDANDEQALPPELATKFAAASTDVSMTTDMWVSPIPGLPAGLSGTPRRLPGMDSSIVARVAALRAALPPGVVVLRSIISTGVVPRSAERKRSENTIRLDLGDVHATEVDPAGLVLPADYVEEPMAGLPAGARGAAGADAGAKWRTAPRAGVTSNDHAPK